jgi:hypothetical protein
VNVDDESLATIAEGWPRVKTLYLGHRTESFDNSHLTFDSLLPLVERCKELRVLGLYINEDSPRMPLYSDERWAKVSNSSVRHLQFDLSPVSMNTFEISSFIVRVFPNANLTAPVWEGSPAPPNF